jgi:uncharacterized protein (TIGR03435 family)
LEEIMGMHAVARRKAAGYLTLTTASSVVLAVLLLGLMTATLAAQSAHAPASPVQPPTPQWQINAGGKMAFDVASVKQNNSTDQEHSNFALGPGDYYTPNGGFFTATSVPLFGYIMFAYKVNANQMRVLLSEVPKWVVTDRFDIQARVAGEPTKDQMRLMMQALLAERFKLVVHDEIRQLPVFVLVQFKPGKPGPRIQAHPADATCSTVPGLSAPGSVSPLPPTVVGGFPTTCGGVQPMTASSPGRVRVGGRNVTMGLIANSLRAEPDGPDRPVLDMTGLSGTFDFTLEWAPQPPGSSIQPDESGPTFLEALRDQLGLKLDSQTGPVDIIVVDRVERPSEN